MKSCPGAAPVVLVGDVGGTHTRLALARIAGGAVQLLFSRRWENARFAGFDALLAGFLTEARAEFAGLALEAGCLGAAGPVEGDRVELTNLGWCLDGPRLAEGHGLPRLRLVNDFLAAASGIELLGAEALFRLQPGQPEPQGNRVVLGAGTGLGIALLTHVEGRWRVLAGEGGHAGFAPETPEQEALVAWLRAREGRVSIEHVVSGPGLVRLHAFLLARAEAGGAGDLEPCTAPAEVTARAEAGDPLADAALRLFCTCYGQVAGDLALAVLARGGVFVAGGIAPRLGRQLGRGGFMAGFRAKGRWAEVLARMPVHLVTDEALALRGAALCALRD